MNKIPGPPVGYVDLIDVCLSEKQNNWNTYPLRPSAAGYCTRRLSYDLMEYLGFAKYEKEVMSPEVKRLLDLGSSVEWHSIKNFEILPKEKFRVKYKQQVMTFFRLEELEEGKPAPLIEGSIDLMLVNVGTGEAAIVDVKSAKDKFSQAYKTYWDETLNKLHQMESTQSISDIAFWVEDLEPFLKELNDPFFSQNFMQVNGYCGTAFAKEHGVTHGVIYRYCKNDSRHFEVRFKPSETLFNKLRDKFNLVYSSVTKEKSAENVPKDFALGSASCAFCPHKAQCWGKDPDAVLKEYFRTFPKKKWPDDLTADDVLSHDIHVYLQHLQEEREVQALEQSITKELQARKMSKVRLPTGEVVEVKVLKTGGVANGPRAVIRRTKA